MNTEDERRDEAEAQSAAQGAVRLEGDVITADGSIISGHDPNLSSEIDEITSVCSCTCYGHRRTPRNGYSFRKSPSNNKVHLMHMNVLGTESRPNEQPPEENLMHANTALFFPYDDIKNKRASI